MRLESITLHLRPRRPYEAMDLGVRLLQHNAWAVYRAWLAFVVPLCLAALTLLSVNFALATLVIWWLKPLYDRIVLFVLARAVFGEPTGLRDVSAGWRSLIGSGLIWALTFRRFDFARSFMLPVYMLEGLKGKRCRERSRVLQKNTRGDAVLLTVAYVHIEQALFWSAIMLLLLLVPQYSSLPVWGWFGGEEQPMAASLLFGAVYIAVLAVVEPFYVASGFTLYLNRRVALEAWDIELDLRRNISEPEPLAAAAE
jgi:hypothetical protein